MLSAGTTVGITTRSVRVLIVEDDANTRWVLCALLKKKGFECRAADDGLKAIEAVRSFSPEIIVMDLMLPGVDGLEATRRIKADAATRGIPILALTANVTPSGESAARDAGCDDFMAKPVVFNELIDWVQAHVRH